MSHVVLVSNVPLNHVLMSHVLLSHAPMSHSMIAIFAGQRLI